MFFNRRNSKRSGRNHRQADIWDGEDWISDGSDAAENLDNLDFSFSNALESNAESNDTDLDDLLFTNKITSAKHGPGRVVDNDSLLEETPAMNSLAYTEEPEIADLSFETEPTDNTTTWGPLDGLDKIDFTDAALDNNVASEIDEVENGNEANEANEATTGNDASTDAVRFTSAPASKHGGASTGERTYVTRQQRRRFAHAAHAKINLDELDDLDLEDFETPIDDGAESKNDALDDFADAATTNNADGTEHANDIDDPDDPDDPDDLDDAYDAEDAEITAQDSPTTDSSYGTSMLGDEPERDINVYASTTSALPGEQVTFTCTVEGVDRNEAKQAHYQWFYSYSHGKKWAKCTSPGCATPSMECTVKKNRLTRTYKCVVMLNDQRLVTDPIGYDIFDETFANLPDKPLGEEIINLDHVTKQYQLALSNQEKSKSSGGFFAHLRHSGADIAIKTAVNDVSFSVRRGESVALIGLNGAGKSTVLKMIAGVVHPTSGTVTVGGKISALLELSAGFDSHMTGRENIAMRANYLGYSQKHIEKITPEIIEFSGLGPYIDQPIRLYSSGMKSRLGFAFAVAIDPEILIIDETLAVGDKAFKVKCKQKIAELISRENVTVIIVTHSVGMAKKMCQRGIVLAEGQKIFDGDIGPAVEVYNEQAALISSATPDDDLDDCDEDDVD